MTRTSRRLLLAAAVLFVLAPSRRAHACDASNPEQYRSDKTIWCVDPDVWAGHSADIKPFFAYGDKIIVQLEQLFGVTPKDLPYTIVARAPDGGAQTPSRYGPGEEVTGDAYYNDAFGVKGFWGYLLTLHELINQWTGLVSGGWPTDWWADHRSPFPNSMDAHIMNAVGMTDAAKAQSMRFNDPSSGDFDAEVGMFDDIFDRYGFAGLRKVFSLVMTDGISWDDLGNNPSELRSEYVIAYLSLPARADLSAGMVKAGVGGTTAGFSDPPYPVKSDVIGGVADAHCAIAAAAAAGRPVSAARKSLQSGDYQSALGVGQDNDCATCPGECGCKAAGMRCVAPWHADLAPPDMAVPGTGGNGNGGTSGTGGNGNGGSSGNGGRSGNGDTGSGHTGCSCQLGARGSDAAGAGAALLVLAGLAGLVVRRRHARR